MRSPNNPQITEFENYYNTNGSQFIYDFVSEAIGGWKKMTKYKLVNTEFQLRFYDNEIELLRDFIDTVYKFDPDFIEGWNSSAFDLEYIIHRIAVLGYDPVEFLSDPTWEFPFLYNHIDNRHINDFAERGDYTRIASNTVWMDQMIQFCSKRKAKMGSFTSFKLDDIAWLIAKVHKYDYSSITNDIGELPYLNYKIFVMYNIIDVISAKCIETSTQDLEYIFTKCIDNCTTYAKGHRQTVYLINRMGKEWYNMPEKYIIGNNVNKNNPKPEKFQGALVENPLDTSDLLKQKTKYGSPLNIADNGVDFDFKALYPSLIAENNIAPNTQIGRIDIWNIWKVKYYSSGKDKAPTVCYIKDIGVAKDFPTTEIDKKKVPKKVELYGDKNYTQYMGTVDYIPDQFETLEYYKFYDNENTFGNDKYSRGGDFIEDMVTDNFVIFCNRWFKFANIREFLIDWQEYNNRFIRSTSRFGTYNRFTYIEADNIVIETPLYYNITKKEQVFYRVENGKEKVLYNLNPMKGSISIDEYDRTKFNRYT